MEPQILEYSSLVLPVGNLIYIYGIGDNNNSWPGVEITNKFNNSGYYTYIDPQTYNMMIFNKGTGGTGNQTSNLNVPIYQDLTYNLSSEEGTRLFYMGNWYSYDTWETNRTTWASTHGTAFLTAQSAVGY